MTNNNLGFSSKVEAGKFFKSNKKDIKKELSKNIRTLDGKSFEREDVLEMLEEISKDLVGGKKADLKNILKELKEKDFKAEDRNKIIKVLEELLLPDNKEKEIADEKLAERQKQIKQIIITLQAEQIERLNNIE